VVKPPRPRKKTVKLKSGGEPKPNPTPVEGPAGDTPERPSLGVTDHDESFEGFSHPDHTDDDREHSHDEHDFEHGHAESSSDRVEVDTPPLGFEQSLEMDSFTSFGAELLDMGLAGVAGMTEMPGMGVPTSGDDDGPGEPPTGWDDISSLITGGSINNTEEDRDQPILDISITSTSHSNPLYQRTDSDASVTSAGAQQVLGDGSSRDPVPVLQVSGQPTQVSPINTKALIDLPVESDDVSVAPSMAGAIAETEELGASNARLATTMEEVRDLAFQAEGGLAVPPLGCESASSEDLWEGEGDSTMDAVVEGYEVPGQSGAAVDQLYLNVPEGEAGVPGADSEPVDLADSTSWTSAGCVPEVDVTAEAGVSLMGDHETMVDGV
jgi:hypothetical protein